MQRALLIWVLVIGFAWSQTDRGSVRGTITDQSGAVVSGATLRITNTATGVVTPTKSGDGGTYNLSGLPAGTYNIEVSQSGFKTLQRNNIVVDVGSVTGLDLGLEIGSSSQTISIDAAAPILKTEQSATSTEVAVDAFGDLPLSAGGGRSPQNFKYLTPGVSNNNSINGSPQLSGQVSMDGITVQNAEVLGADNNVRFPPEAVGEMSVITSAYSAEYGQTAGGVQRYTIKSGTNQYHGNVYEYFKNTVLDARGFFNVVRPADHQNEYGFSLGGPISIPKLYNGKNRSFFFFNGDWFTTRRAGATSIISLPNAAFRAGDFSGNLGAAVAGVTNACTGGVILSGQIFDPSTTRTVNGQQCRDPFPGNVIPVSRISTAAQALLRLVPATTTQAVLNNAYVQADPSFNNFHDYTVKGDHYFGSNHHFSGTVVDSENPSGGGSILPSPLTSAGATIYSWINARATYNWILTPNLMNELKLGYNREIFTHSPTGSDAPGWQAQLGIPGFQSASSLFPGILWGSYRTLGNQQFWYATSNTYVLNDSVSWTKGRHNLKFGVEYDDLWHALWKDWPAQITFSRGATGFPTSLGATGNEAASLLLGLVDNANIPSLKNTSVNYQWKTFDGYVQDDYKVTARFTLNFGVRWSLFVPMRERNNIYSAVDLAKPNPAAGNLPGTYVFAGLDGQGSRLSPVQDNVNRFAPRAGLAWKLSNRLVLRSGYGVSYFPTGAFGSGNNVFLTDGYDPTSSVATPDSGVTPALNLSTGFPADKLLTLNLTPSYSIGSNFNYWSKYVRQVAAMQSWNVSTQFELRPNLALDIAYVGSKGTHLSSLENINQLDPAYLALGGTLLNSNINSPAVVAAGFKSPWPGFVTALGANATLAQALRPYPQYLSGFGYNSDNDGNSTYHALQTKLERRMANGLYLLAAYTWNKSITDANTTLYSVPGNNPTGSGRVRDQFNRHLDKAVASVWQPHVLTMAVNYELPFGPGKQFLNSGRLINHVVGGWRLGGILTYRTGALISVTAPQTLPLFAGPNYATTVLGVSQLGTWEGRFDPAVNRYLNAAAFTLPAPNTFGTGAQYLPNVRGPAYSNEDLSLSKRIAIKERFNLELRIETFNALNRVVFGGPAADVSNPTTFGRITTQANSPRNAQLTAKLNF